MRVRATNLERQNKFSMRWHCVGCLKISDFQIIIIAFSTRHLSISEKNLITFQFSTLKCVRNIGRPNLT